MSEIVDAYTSTRARMCELLVTATEEERGRVVPACPAWRAQDLLAHVVSLPSAIASGRRPSGSIGDWLEELIDERKSESAEALIADWLAVDAYLPALLEGPSALLYGDLAVHEHDLRGALARPDHDALEVAVILPRTLAGFSGPLRAAGLGPIGVRHGVQTWQSHDGPAGWTLLVDPWTAVRAVNSRRTAEELLALPCEGDAQPYLAILDAHLPLPAYSLGE